MSRAVIVINGNYDRDRAAQWAKSAPSGCIIEFKQSKRTLDQNARLWACLTEIARKVDWYGKKLPADDWKDVFTAALRRTRVVPGIDAGTFVPLGMRTSDMTKQEFSDLLELINAFAAEHGVTFDFDDAGDTPETGTGDRTADPDETGAEQTEAGNGSAASSAPVDPTKLSDEDRKWLVMAARMLIPSAAPNGDPDIVRNQYGALIKHQTPPSISQLAIGKAVSISKRLVAVCESTEELDLELLAGIAGCTVEEIRT